MIMHIYIYIHIFFFNNYYFKSRRHGILLLVVRLESGHLFDLTSSPFKNWTNPQNKFKSRCFQLRQGMTTATTRKDDIGLVSFKDVCTLMHRIKTYHRKEGGKAKKHIAREYLDKFFENHYPRFFNGGERKDAFRLYRLLAPQVVNVHVVRSLFSLFLVFCCCSLSLNLSEYYESLS